MTETEQQEPWTTDQVATYLGLKTRAAARAQLAVWQINPIGRQPGRSGQNLYNPGEIKQRKLARVGRGYRTDLHRKGKDE